MSILAAAAAIVSIGSTLIGSSKQNEAYENQAKIAAAEAAYNIRAAERQIGSIQRALQVDELRGEDLRSNIEYARREGYLFSARADFTASQAGLFEKRAGHSERVASLQDDRAGLHRGRVALHDRQGQENKNRSVLSAFYARVSKEGAKGQLFNARVQETLANEVLDRGDINAETIRFKEEAHIGTQKVSAAARGVDVSSGSAADLTSSTEFLSEREQTIVRNDAALKAFQYRVQGYNYRSKVGEQVGNVLGHQQASRQATLDADRSYQSSEEAKATAREAKLSAAGSRLGAGELRNRAQGAILSSEGLRNQAIGSELKAQGLITTEADRLRKRADAFQQQETLQEKQELFALQGVYGARAASLQGEASTITALGQIAVPIANLIRDITTSADKH